MAETVRVDGLTDLRRSLRAVDKGALKEVQQVTKRAAQLVAAQAARNAPRGTQPIPPSRHPRQRLADAYKAGTRGSSGIVRNPLIYSRIFEYRRHGSLKEMRHAHPVDRALDAKAEQVGQALARGFDELARRNGWT